MNETILVCLSPSPSNMQVIQKAYRSLHEHDKMIAVYVSNHKQGLNETEQRQLDKNIEAASNLNADIEIIYADDVLIKLFDMQIFIKLRELLSARAFIKKEGRLSIL